MSKDNYTVKKGDSLWGIAKKYNMSLEYLQKLNPSKKDMIHPNDILRLKPKTITKRVNLREERKREAELNKDNISAIQGAYHDSNYGIVDKVNNTVYVYDKNNNLIYKSTGISTGLSGNDYNTITYTGGGGGDIRNYEGNNSTPAGILGISGTGKYHNSPSFTRARLDPYTGDLGKINPSRFDDVASSIHFGDTSKAHSSNGCIRTDAKTLKELQKYLGVGSKVYTLPEKEGSRFVLKNGRLNFVADNPFGVTEKGKNISKGNHDMIYWDDYNTYIDKTYSPLRISWKNTGNKEYDNNKKSFAQAIVNNKEKFQKQFNLTSDEYNRLAELALGIAEQETKYGTSKRYKGKQAIGEEGVSTLKGIESLLKTKGKWNPWKIGIAGISYILNPGLTQNVLNFIGKKKGDKLAQSRGYTQIKNTGDNKELQNIYKNLGIDNNSIKTAEGAAKATLARLASMYNQEVRGKNFTDAKDRKIDSYDALLYKWNGHNERLTNKTAIPENNEYINNVKKYSNEFNFFEDRKYNVFD